MLLADAAHSLGAFYKGKASGTVADVTVFSLHSVKNITTGEGGAIVIEFTAAFQQPERTDFPEGLGIERAKQECFRKKSGGCVAV